MRLRQAPVNAKAAGTPAAELLDSVTTSVIHLDRRGGIVAANDPAHAQSRKGDGPSDEDGLPRASLPEEDAPGSGAIDADCGIDRARWRIVGGSFLWPGSPGTFATLHSRGRRRRLSLVRMNEAVWN